MYSYFRNYFKATNSFQLATTTSTITSLCCRDFCGLIPSTSAQQRHGRATEHSTSHHSEYGQSNVIVAVAYELLLQGEFDVHIASVLALE